MALPKLIRNIIPEPYCDNILNHDTNKGIVMLVTLMVKSNETIIKMKGIAVTFQNFVKVNLIPSMWQILQYLLPYGERTSFAL